MTQNTTNFSEFRNNLILAATIISAGMVYLDGTLITVAQESIRQEFKAELSDLQWLHSIYLLFLTVPILISGTLSDRYGRRRLFNIGLVGFTVASAACGAAMTIDQLNLARAFQGLFGGIMIPGSLAIINATFPPQIRGKTVGIWSAFTALTTAIGPLLGGWLVDAATWRAGFLINVPLGLVALGISVTCIPESKSKAQPESEDWMGIGLFTMGLTALTFGLIEGAAHNWAEWIYIHTIAGGAILLIGFVVWEMLVEYPLIPMSLFKNRVFTGITLLTLVLYFAMSGTFFFVPLLMQQTYDLSATLTGSLLMPLIVLLFITSQWSGMVADKYGARGLLIVGPILIAVGSFLCMVPGIDNTPPPFLKAISPDTLIFLSFLPATIILGAGLGLTVPPLTTVALAVVPREMSGLASGVSNGVSRVATILAVAILGAIMLGQFAISIDKRVENLPLSEADHLFLDKEILKLGSAEPPPNLSPEIKSEVERVIDLAFIDSFRMMMGLCGILALFSALITLSMIDDAAIAAQNQGVSKKLPSIPHI